ncbi:desmethyl-deoxy-podophyllotoxin synthase-like [Phragmites australis]|uniref:desmethyl-deoxy-podophyllotoxin synthase-like n=1 Tax=Phragmites australis TaxID=29695 RepID=UPI002D772B83|nr:desmethyl-deoxy-podophyllotoxin synthase-like [Phragmites australis]
MELLPWCLCLLLLLLPALVLLELHCHRTPRATAPLTRLPPGPWRLPVIGSLHHLLTMKDARLVHRAMAVLARRCNAPVMYVQLGELHVVVVSSANAAREVIREHDANFATRTMTMTMRDTIGDMVGLVLSPHGAMWRRLRRICTVQLLSARRVRSFRPIREDEAARLAHAIATDTRAAAPGERQVMNVSELVSRLVSDTVLRAIMGERFRWREEFMATLAKAMMKGAEFSAADLFPSSRLLRTIGSTLREAKALNTKLFGLVDRAIDQRRERKAGVAAEDDDNEMRDLLDVLLRLQEHDDHDCALPLPTIKAVILDMFGTGSSTTSTTIQWAILELMRNPKVMQKVQQEIRHALGCKSRVTEDDLINLKYLKLVIKETFRLHPATAVLFPKECQESCKILGYDVPKGMLMIMNVWAIGRDPEYWDDAEVFKPERFEGITVDFKGTDFQFLPFGGGRRMCPGIMFAHANIELALATLLYHFDWQLPPGVTPDAVDMTEKFGVDVRPKRDVYLCPILVVPPEAEA